MVKNTRQMNEWSSDFGRQYTDRNAQSLEQMERLYRDRFGISRTAMNEVFLADLPRDLAILEVGCNIGNQLLCLQKMGFSDLTGLEVQPYAAQLARERCQGIEIIEGSAFDLPFADLSYDLVFTSGVLIHLAPRDLPTAMDQIHRCTRRYVWGYEYWADTHQEIAYRHKQDLMWKGDFAAMYLNRFPDLRLVKQKKFKYLDEDNIDAMFLLAVG